jgi:hypothetical protein
VERPADSPGDYPCAPNLSGWVILTLIFKITNFKQLK